MDNEENYQKKMSPVSDPLFQIPGLDDSAILNDAPIALEFDSAPMEQAPALDPVASPSVSLEELAQIEAGLAQQVPGLPPGIEAQPLPPFAPALSPDQVAPSQPGPISPAPELPIGVSPRPPMASQQPILSPTQVTTVTDKKIMSPEAKKAMADYDKAVKKQQEAINAETEAATNAALVQGEYNRAFADTTEKVASEFANTLSEADKQIADTQRELDTRITEFANQKPETFWGSKTEGDRIAAAVSVGLGSLGQALLGSKENVGMVLLKRSMDEFEAGQKEIYNRQLKSLENQKLSIDQKLAAKSSLKFTYDAKMLAATEKVKQQWAIAMQQAKTPEIVAKAQKASAMLDSQAAAKKMEIMKDYAETVKTTAIKKAISALASNMNPDQRRAALESAKELRKIQSTMLTNTADLGATLKVLRDPTKSYDLKLNASNNSLKSFMLRPEAMGDKERETYGGFITSSFDKIAKHTASGAAGGATLGGGIGAAIGGGATFGTMTLPGAALGAILGTAAGGTAGLVSGLSSASTTPGGIKFNADIEGHAGAVEQRIKQYETSMKFNGRVADLIEKEGLSLMEAMTIANKEMGGQ